MNFGKGVPSRMILEPIVNHSKVISKDEIQLSWKEVLLTDKPTKRSIVTEQHESLLYTALEGVLVSLNKQLVGEVLNWEDIDTLQQSLHREGVLSVQTIPLGGKLFMLKSESQVNIQ